MAVMTPTNGGGTYTTRIGIARVGAVPVRAPAPAPSSPVPASQPTNQLFQSVTGQVWRYNPSTSSWFQAGTVGTAAVAHPALPQPPTVIAPRPTPPPPTPPTSPVSGQPIQTAIYQPTATPTSIASQSPASAGSNYVAPEHPLLQGAQPITAIVPATTQALQVADTAQPEVLGGLDANSILVLLAVIAVIIFLVTQS